MILKNIKIGGRFFIGKEEFILKSRKSEYKYYYTVLQLSTGETMPMPYNSRVWGINIYAMTPTTVYLVLNTKTSILASIGGFDVDFESGAYGRIAAYESKEYAQQIVKVLSKHDPARGPYGIFEITIPRPLIPQFGLALIKKSHQTGRETSAKKKNP